MANLKKILTSAGSNARICTPCVRIPPHLVVTSKQNRHFASGGECTTKTSDMLKGVVPNHNRKEVLMSTATAERRLSYRSKPVPGEPEVQSISIAEAAQLSGVSDDTIRRRINAGKLPGAYRDGPSTSAQWRIPVEALVAAGLCEPETIDQLDDRLNPNVARLQVQLAELRAELLTERIRRESAERMFADSTVEVQYLRRVLERVLAGSSDDARGARKLA